MATETPAAATGTATSDLYEVLDVERGATQAELRQRYRELALELHPDKNVGQGGDATRFVALQEAWAVLSDEAERRAYDARLQAAEAPAAAAAEIDIDDLAWDGVAKSFVHTCRCSDMVHVTEADLDKGCEIFECPSCSLRIRVVFQVSNDQEDDDERE
ncbi:DnaJ family protein [Hondaea fermentalgiana]|uniref:DnaJ family protein n=1 Tax=Hondaea fermentalgiana TaxID=2315210 RepID=A0A2R5GC66_9STRA|nr:DnaJ family protein [Hondaea fermentalgiana]|eukprot:GBG27909.1 DnaJ family protein [Hondaea fermentalgiana]